MSIKRRRPTKSLSPELEEVRKGVMGALPQLGNELASVFGCAFPRISTRDKAEFETRIGITFDFASPRRTLLRTGFGETGFEPTLRSAKPVDLRQDGQAVDSVVKDQTGGVLNKDTGKGTPKPHFALLRRSRPPSFSLRCGA